MTGEPGFGDATPRWFAADVERGQRAAHDALQTQVQTALANPGSADREVMHVLRLIAGGDIDGAKKAAPDRKSRWPVFRLLPDVAGRLWPDTGREWETTVRTLGDPSRW